MSSEEIVRLDYLKFMFRMDHDAFQQTVVTKYHSILVSMGISPDNRSKTHLTALGKGADGVNRYIIEIYGPDTHAFANHIPAWWLPTLRRIDLRRELPQKSPEVMRSVLRAQTLPNAKKPTSSFDSKPRHKMGDARDVGGIGMYFQSRKSGQHGCLYKRGKESPAWEYRVRDKLAEKVGETAYRMVEAAKGWWPRGALLHVMDELSLDFQLKVMGMNADAYVNTMATAGEKLMQAVAQLEMFAETPEEREWWSQMSTEDQSDCQRITVEPTPKGWAVASEAEPANGGSIDDYGSHIEIPF